MSVRSEKTPEIRARELFKMVYGGEPYAAVSSGWLKLGKFVLSLEKKWAKARGRKAR